MLYQEVDLGSICGQIKKY